MVPWVAAARPAGRCPSAARSTVLPWTELPARRPVRAAVAGRGTCSSGAAPPDAEGWPVLVRAAREDSSSGVGCLHPVGDRRLLQVLLGVPAVAPLAAWRLVAAFGLLLASPGAVRWGPAAAAALLRCCGICCAEGSDQAQSPGHCRPGCLLVGLLPGCCSCTKVPHGDGGASWLLSVRRRGRCVRPRVCDSRGATKAFEGQL